MISQRSVDEDGLALWIKHGANNETRPWVYLGLSAGLEVAYHHALAAPARPEEQNALVKGVEGEPAVRAELRLRISQISVGQSRGSPIDGIDEIQASTFANRDIPAT